MNITTIDKSDLDNIVTDTGISSFNNTPSEDILSGTITITKRLCYKNSMW